MENNLQVFNYNDSAVRTVQKDGEPWFVLKDVCQVLGLSDTNRTAERLDSDELTRAKLVSGGQEREMYVINESGLYTVILRSDKPEAKPFRKWVTSEVLPTIRRHGMYATQDTVEAMLADPDTAIRLLNTLKEERAARQALEAQAEADAPKVLFADAVSASQSTILIGELAKILQQNGVVIGQKRLFAWMREKGYLMKRNSTDFNMPTQRAMEQGLFKIKETTIVHSDGSTSVNKTVKVTGKGQQFFVNKFLKEKERTKCGEGHDDVARMCGGYARSWDPVFSDACR